MSKKKNTLKDLDEFLKQQAATLVAPAQLSDQIEKEKPAPASAPVAAVAPVAAGEVTPESIGQALQALYRKQGAPAFRQALYDIILNAAETPEQSLPEDKMLVNTVLYLKSGERWKETIRAYWRNK